MFYRNEAPRITHEVENKTTDLLDDEVLDCGKPVNFTYYDNLVGVANRLSHPNVPEPQVRNTNLFIIIFNTPLTINIVKPSNEYV